MRFGRSMVNGWEIGPRRDYKHTSLESTVRMAELLFWRPALRVCKRSSCLLKQLRGGTRAACSRAVPGRIPWVGIVRVLRWIWDGGGRGLEQHLLGWTAACCLPSRQQTRALSPKQGRAQAGCEWIESSLLKEFFPHTSCIACKGF